MSLEREQPPHPQPTPTEVFGLTEHEALFDRVSDERFNALVGDEATTVHRIEVTSNSYGEFLFVTVSRAGLPAQAGSDRRVYLTFFGQGFHEYRERWLTEEWFWYATTPWGELAESEVAKDTALSTIQERRAEIEAIAARDTQSQRGQLFEMLADLTDEDGALAEMDDLPWWLLTDDL